VVGVIPYVPLHLEEEDRLKERHCPSPEIDIAVIYLPHLANSSDFNPLADEANVRVRFVRSQEELGAPDMIILPGSTNTLCDLAYIQKIGLEKSILERSHFTPLMGICGGFEMMGKTILDPHAVESTLGSMTGMALFDFDVVLNPTKVV